MTIVRGSVGIMGLILIGGAGRGMRGLGRGVRGLGLGGGIELDREGRRWLSICKIASGNGREEFLGVLDLMRC